MKHSLRLLVAILTLSQIGCFAPEQHFAIHSPEWEMANPPFEGRTTPEAQAEMAKRHRVIIAVLDGGFDYNHPFLRRNIHPFATPESSGRTYGVGFDTLGDDFFPHYTVVNIKTQEDLSLELDIQDHGTHVAGLAALKNPAIGILPVRVLPVWMTEEEDQGSYSLRFAAKMAHRSVDMIASGIDFAVAHGASILNMSLGMSIEGLHNNDQATLLQHAAEVLAAPMSTRWKNALFIVAAGNDHLLLERHEQSLPATLNEPHVLAIGALKDHTTISYYSNYGRYVDLYVRGSDITSAVPLIQQSPGNRNKLSGSSMAAPLAAHAAAELKLIAPELTGPELRALLLNTADERTLAIEPLPDASLKEPKISRKVRVLNFLKAKRAARHLTEASTQEREKLLTAPFLHGHAE